uniref:Uncharacterized protein n=1 Tax=Candidatus Kentrum sp. SD TaxID=2126332 RepID=A0A450Z3A7_9GAMM|nr:MAG: hypothetical protein BECKSD772F_GA0070984_102529 [Candidatus Kentron sp. SD]VFK48286.1 MAG: hypothetical protein BECKSD772E_GA0070983_111910 [Candidatus Kentron sp. SD]VFK80419.1 MAG: hypothetical protein BECKSD772D_GA0070982_11131 [Candidatus Kentron sp. SD]
MQSSHVLEDITDTHLGEGQRYNLWNDAVSEALPPKQAREMPHRIGLEIGMAFQEGVDSGPDCR